MNRERIVLLAKQKMSKKIEHSCDWEIANEWQKYILDVINDINPDIAGFYTDSFEYLAGFVDFSRFPNYLEFIVHAQRKMYHYKETLEYLIDSCYSKDSASGMTMKNE